MLTAHEIRRVSVQAACDPRSVRAFLKDPDSVRGTTAERVREALKALSLTARSKAPAFNIAAAKKAAKKGGAS